VRSIHDGPSEVQLFYEFHLSQIKRIDEHGDHANRAALVNEIIEAFRQ
jgi:hypothetical protein